MGPSKSAHFIRTVVAREQESELRVSNEVLGYDFTPVDDDAEDLSRVRLRIRGERSGLASKRYEEQRFWVLALTSPCASVFTLTVVMAQYRWNILER